MTTVIPYVDDSFKVFFLKKTKIKNWKFFRKFDRDSELFWWLEGNNKNMEFKKIFNFNKWI